MDTLSGKATLSKLFASRLKKFGLDLGDNSFPLEYTTFQKKLGLRLSKLKIVSLGGNGRANFQVLTA